MTHDNVKNVYIIIISLEKRKPNRPIRNFITRLQASSSLQSLIRKVIRLSVSVAMKNVIVFDNQCQFKVNTNSLETSQLEPQISLIILQPFNPG